MRKAFVDAWHFDRLRAHFTALVESTGKDARAYIGLGCCCCYSEGRV